MVYPPYHQLHCYSSRPFSLHNLLVVTGEQPEIYEQGRSILGISRSELAEEFILQKTASGRLHSYSHLHLHSGII